MAPAASRPRKQSAQSILLCQSHFIEEEFERMSSSEEKFAFLHRVLHTDQEALPNDPECDAFRASMKGIPESEFYPKVANVLHVHFGEELVQDENTPKQYHPSIVTFCKIVLKMKAFSGISGSIVEKNINYVYALLTEDPTTVRRD